MKTRKISGCDSCVFAYENERRKMNCDLESIVTEHVPDGEVHRDCPLRQGPLQFVLAKEAAGNNDVAREKRCRDCGKFFHVTYGEIRFLEERFGATFREPSRCKSCRIEKKKQGNGNGFGNR